MASSFAWLAVDAEQRRRMMEAVDLFRDETTIDDLGIGAIRDAFSDTLFPGTSTLHTRLRYVFVVPWLLEEAARKDTVEQMGWAFHDLERDFIDALKRGLGDEQQGIIGRRVGKNLQRVPSGIYWGTLTAWGLLEPRLSVRGYFRRAVLRREQLRTAPRAEEADTRLELTPTGLDPHLPDAPRDLLKSATFALSLFEASYLGEAITRSVPGTLLARLAHVRPHGWSDLDSAPPHLWDEAITDLLDPDADTKLATTVDLAQRFSLYSQGANLLYNLLLAEATSHGPERFEDDPVEDYRRRLGEWADEAAASRPLDATDQGHLAAMMLERNRRFTPATRDFLATWFDAARSPHAVPDHAPLRRVIAHRESSIKGARARLRPGNQRALDAWGGESGTARLQFRWPIVRRHLQDLYDGLEAA